MSKVTVIMPSYNHQKYVGQAIESVLKQTYQDFQLEIVDDASEDDSWKIIQSYSDSRIHAVRMEKNTGFAHFHRTVRKVTTEYTAVICSDDVWAPDKLEKQMAYLEQHPDVDACFTWVNMIGEDGTPFEKVTDFYWKIFDQSNRSRCEWLNIFFYHGNCLCFPSCVIRTKAYGKYQMLQDGLASLHDFYEWAALLVHGGNLHVLEERLTSFRVRDNSANESGDKPQTSIRSNNELPVVLKLYRDLDEKDFLQVFPQASQFVKDGQIVLDYALAQLLLSGPDQLCYKAVGYEILSQAAADPEKWAKIQELYGYGLKELSRQMLQWDVFSAVDTSKKQQAMLYIDWGEGFKEEDRLKTLSYVMPDGSFEASFLLPEGGRSVKGLTYYPDYGTLREYRILQVYSDQGPLCWKPDSAVQTDGWDVFSTFAPNYHFSSENGADLSTNMRRVTIKGMCRMRDVEHLAVERDELIRELAESKQKIEQQLLTIYEKDTQIFNQTNRINELESWEVIWRQRSDILDQVYASRTWRYTHKLVTMARKVLPAGSLRSRVVGGMLRIPLRFEHWVRDQYHQIQQKQQRRAYFRSLGILSFPQSEHPDVSIVIPVYNQFDYTIRCLESILRTCEGLDYEVILADDCSTDETRSIAEKVHGIHVVRNQTNLRFLRNCNHAAESARGKYILFLNNDTVVYENWLQSLLSLMESRPDCGMAGSKLVFADGRLQEAGGILWNDGSAWNYGRLQDPENSEFNYVKEVDYISGCSILIRAGLWKQLGGFDDRFAPAYCEDSDLAFQVRAAGYKVLYQPLSVVTHYEGVSNGTDLSSGQKKYQEINQKKFLEKWQEVLAQDHFENAQNVFCARERSAQKPCLLMVDHYVPTYDQDAGSRTVFEYLKLFVKMGYNVKFIPDNFNRSEPYTTTLQQMGIEVLYGPWYAQHWKEWVKENAAHIQYVFLNRPHISVKYIDFLRQVTSARIIYYGHDLHFLREERQYEITKDPALLESSAKWRAIELSLMRKADMAYYPSSIEEAYIHNISPDIRVKAIPAYIYTDVETPEYKLSRRKDLMFIGGFGHTPNVDAVEWLAKEIWPLVRAERKDICVHILGSHPPKEIEAMNAPDFQVHGFVSDEELNQFYAECRMSIVPLRYGAGIKGKVVEAMKNGIPVVTTSVGSEGITGCEDFLAVCDDAEAFARKILDLYENEQALARMSEQECKYIREHFSPENAMNTIKEDFS